jgi:predicted SAM-dependent methyltransferase
MKNITEEGQIKLHLGCGEQYLEGYTNIDFPVEEHSVMKPKADKFADIRSLQYESGSISEIRSHHVFEHFSRAETLKLLKQWHGWLQVGGKLVIETPDFENSIKKFIFADIQTQSQLLRHIFGSQEAKWAYHLDGWYAKKFKYILKQFGFTEIKTEKFSNRLAQKLAGKVYGWRPLMNLIGDLVPQFVYRRHGGHKMPNIVVTAIKTDLPVEFATVIRQILALGLVGGEDEDLLNVWVKEAQEKV